MSSSRGVSLAKSVLFRRPTVLSSLNSSTASRMMLLRAGGGGPSGGSMVPRPPVADTSADAARMPTAADDDGLTIMDYPKVPDEVMQARDPHKYWDKQSRRDFGETMNENDEAFGVWVYDQVTPVDPYTSLKHLSMALVGLFAIFQIARFVNREDRKVAAPRTMPYAAEDDPYGSAHFAKAQ
eukprot:Nk52_evm20s211 gene=Nk52_evmTU20s211